MRDHGWGCWHLHLVRTKCRHEPQNQEPGVHRVEVRAQHRSGSRRSRQQHPREYLRTSPARPQWAGQDAAARPDSQLSCRPARRPAGLSASARSLRVLPASRTSFRTNPEQPRYPTFRPPSPPVPTSSAGSAVARTTSAARPEWSRPVSPALACEARRWPAACVPASKRAWCGAGAGHRRAQSPTCRERASQRCNWRMAAITASHGGCYARSTGCSSSSRLTSACCRARSALGCIQKGPWCSHCQRCGRCGGSACSGSNATTAACARAFRSLLVGSDSGLLAAARRSAPVPGSGAGAGLGAGAGPAALSPSAAPMPHAVPPCRPRAMAAPRPPPRAGRRHCRGTPAAVLRGAAHQPVTSIAHRHGRGGQLPAQHVGSHVGAAFAAACHGRADDETDADEGVHVVLLCVCRRGDECVQRRWSVRAGVAERSCQVSTAASRAARASSWNAVAVALAT